MRIFLGSLLVVGLLAALAPGQDDENTQVYTNASPPPREALDRLNLKMAWRAYVPVEGRRDGLLRVELASKQILALTRGGMVAALDAETGQSIWRTRVGNAYRMFPAVAWNSRSVFVVSGTKLYSLDRNRGTTQWEFEIPPGISGAAVDDDQFYLCTSTGRVYAYLLPRLLFRVVPRGSTPGVDEKEDKKADKKDDMKSDKEGEKKSNDARPSNDKGYAALGSQLTREEIANPAPELVWDQGTRLRLDERPLQTETYLVLSSSNGRLAAVNKYPQTNTGSTEVFTYDAGGDLGAPPGRFDDLVFLGTVGGELNAISLSRDGERVWRHTGGSAVTRMPVGLDVQVGPDRYQPDLFVVTQRGGLARLDRETGEPLWRIPRGRTVAHSVPEADRFLAANRKFVYAADRSGRLLVLDRVRGTVLSTYDIRNFVFPVVNDQTDRLYLAAHNGLVVCLRDKEYTSPMNHRAAEEKAFDPKRLPPVDRAMVEEQQRSLEVLVSDPGGEPVPLRQLLGELERRYAIRIDLASNRTFKDYKMEPIAEEPVKFPKVSKAPLKDVLKQILGQVGADYVIRDRIYVVPAKLAKGKEADKEPMKDDAKPKDKDVPKDKDAPKDKDMKMEK